MRLNNVLASHPRNIIPKKKNKKKKRVYLAWNVFLLLQRCAFWKEASGTNLIRQLW